MGVTIYINGEYYTNRDEAKISVYDHGFLYGDGTFEGIRVYNNNIFKLKEHVDRMYDSAKALCLEIPHTPEEMTEIIKESVKRSGMADCYIRPIITRGKGDLGLDPKKCGKPTVIVIVDAIQLYPQELYETGIPVITVPTNRLPSQAFNPRVKSLNYLNNVMAKIEANNGNVLEAIMLNIQGFVAECSADNIFIIKDKEITTPPDYSDILRGITRDTIIDIARDLGYKVVDTKNVTRYELFVADEVFMCGSGAEIMPLIAIDGRQIGDGKPGPITKELLGKYREMTGMK